MTSPDQPLVSFTLLAYNQERFIREAVEGAFSQTYSPLEIILSDDCSKDRTFEIMQEMAATYKGPHKIVLNRNPKNLGVGRHYNKVMELTSGEIVELAAGDDISLPWRTADSVSVFMEHPEATCVSLGFKSFSDDPDVFRVLRQEIKILKKWSLNDYLENPNGYFLNAPGRAFRKYTHDYYGPLIEECPVEDGPNMFRCLLHGTGLACENVGVLYRWNGLNISSPENIWRISRSAIWADILNTTKIAFSLGHIDDATRQKLEITCEALKERALLLEKLHNRAVGFFTIRRLLLSRHFTANEKLKLCAKLLLRFLGAKRWKL